MGHFHAAFPPEEKMDFVPGKCVCACLYLGAKQTPFIVRSVNVAENSRING